MKFYILSDCSGLLGYYATKLLARQAAEDAFNFDKQFSLEPPMRPFQKYWEEDCHLEEAHLELED